MSTESLRPPGVGAEARPLFWVTRKGARIALIVVHIAAIISVLIELIYPFPEDSHTAERVHTLDFLASYAIYGFVACVILVLFGLVLRRLVMRDENYYDGGR